jgi:hypothetical protein
MYNSGILLSAGSAEDLLLLMAVIVCALVLILSVITGFTLLKRNWLNVPDLVEVITSMLAKHGRTNGSIKNKEENRHDFSSI